MRERENQLLRAKPGTQIGLLKTNPDFCPGILQARTLEWVAISFPNACMHAMLLQSCPTLCNPMDSSPPGSSVHRILQARILEWVAISFSNACMHAKLLQSCPTLQPYGQQPTRLLCPQDSPGKNTGVGCHFLPQCMHAF